jgi:hypothetical protein
MPCLSHPLWLDHVMMILWVLNKKNKHREPSTK